jgi:AMIN domain
VVGVRRFASRSVTTRGTDMWTITRRAGVLTLAATVGLALTATTVSASSTDLPAPTGTAPVSATGTATGLGETKLVNVRTGRHAAYDRTVFDFTAGTPGYHVEYGTLVNGGSGSPIPLAGAASLVVVFTPAFAHDVNTGAVTYDITRTLNPKLPTLQQIRFGEDFEAHVSAGLGLVDRVGFRVFQLHNPDRVVIDVAHQPTQPFGTQTVWVGDASQNTIVNGVRSGRHPGYDRLVFDLATTEPSLTFVGYRTTTSTLTVGFSGRNVPAVLPGPGTVHFGLPALRDLSWQGYGNGTATAFVSTAHRHGFRVMILHQPTRLVVDVAH